MRTCKLIKRTYSLLEKSSMLDCKESFDLWVSGKIEKSLSNCSCRQQILSIMNNKSMAQKYSNSNTIFSVIFSLLPLLYDSRTLFLLEGQYRPGWWLMTQARQKLHPGKGLPWNRVSSNPGRHPAVPCPHCMRPLHRGTSVLPLIFPKPPNILIVSRTICDVLWQLCRLFSPSHPILNLKHKKSQYNFVKRIYMSESSSFN